MNPETGEIKDFEDGKVPVGWEGLPVRGDEVEVVAPPGMKRGRMWKVVAIVQGKPGNMVIEPLPDTIKKARKARNSG